MAASAKRKQEEKHLKMLREMTSLPPNRKCFDCDQRGPTYANMTVGSFVCTSCSGILRGLNPPHRVKSISMTTFLQQEIEFLQKHGNEVCKQIWLGLYDDRTSSVPDFREPQKVKEFLQDKYEKKRWYVPPEQAKTVASVHASISGSSNSSTNSTPEVRPLKTLLGDSAPTLHLSKGTPPNQSPVVSRGQAHPQQFHDKKFDLLSDLGGDIFAAPPTNVNAAAGSSFANFAHFNSHTMPQNTSTGAEFAHFDAFGNGSDSKSGFPSAPEAAFQPLNTAFTVLSSSRSMGEFATALPLQSAHRGAVPAGVSSGTAGGVAGLVQKQPAGTGGGDRYAALAELDTVFSSSAPATSVYNTSSTSQGSVFGSETAVSAAHAQQAMPGVVQGFGAPPSTNPFVAAGPAAAPTNPFQCNGRAPQVAAAAGLMRALHWQGHTSSFASFGTGSMSMPAGFGNAAAFNLPTSFSGTFQPVFPGQAPFPQPPAFPQQPNGGGFPAFGPAKPVVTPFGQAVMAPVVPNNPFLGSGPPAQFPAGGSSTNPFL
ncbi:arf-GAP domain and FG repeat-containing protein 1a isoform X6 [Austrofundulus limnaeus]|uniref:Arf-GAP domain and FG repeat-containing protein 1a isoform X6 n=1 Tax=Austrofundulus limnaeus TaxID=52670 RepID=A0A2I4C0U8_AUSLI|nr:PREDICTED: arf-GAP domain and FG repeat-containing protein 1 isoform X6 [Austrofundulus limnaeus]